MKTVIYITLLFSVACSSAKKKPDEVSESTSLDSTTVTLKTIPSNRTPLDTVVASYPNGKKLYLLVLDFHDSLPGNLIRDFEVKDANTNESIFNSPSIPLVLGDIVDPMTDMYDSIRVIPAYSVATRTPLTINLIFLIDGSFMIDYLSDLTYVFNGNSRLYENQFDFLKYSFIDSEKSRVQSSLLFTPQKCGLSEGQILNQFHKLKEEGHLYTDQGSELVKQSFLCFLNGDNSYYHDMMAALKSASAYIRHYNPYNYYSYVYYFNQFIIDPTF
ncbi:MAG: hypothetical protein R2820_03980 [Cyclobacteriaceae bacterium]